ncbi:mycothiol synthase [Brachybacterium sp. AOP43-C2-M15]|uniref:mycothiol synthase n=1 Tax=Brachybacterium sp. AOP43-C2-M15 TaxID=3457661 RepID=UPI004034494A
MITTAALSPIRREAILDLLATATAHDGVSPLDEAATLALESRDARHLLLEAPAGAGPTEGALIGYASVLSDGTVQGMVRPGHRRNGHGTALLRAALEERPDAGIWAHGALEGSLAFLAGAGLVETRRLLTLRRDLGGTDPVPTASPTPPEGLRLAAFDPARDAERWVEVNAAAFADHPEQGALTRADLDQRLAQPWFDAEDMMVALREEELVGFVWVKRERPGDVDADAEIYVVATDPSVQGLGVGGTLMAASLVRLQEAGVPGVELYVEADNTAALRLYETLGFAVSGRDVQMRATGEG